MVKNKNNYLIIDIGTGNVRAAVTTAQGRVLGIERNNISYHKDNKYQEALEFDPNELWSQILSLCKKVLSHFPNLTISAITVSSQREGIVLLEKNNISILGLPNHDHRGRKWEGMIENKDFIYKMCGRYPSSIFSALKLVGLREKRRDIFKRIETFLSISDWAQFLLSGVKGYEHSQASETLLYDVNEKRWSPELCEIFQVNTKVLPPLHTSGDILGPILPEIAKELGLPLNVKIIVGGSDTQLAIKSTSPKLHDVIIVAGTTTPIVKLTSEYIIDPNQRTWTNRHVDKEKFILETNAGITGLNLQRLKDIFFPNEKYTTMEEELKQKQNTTCIASLGSLIAQEEKPITMGGFLIETPLSHNLKRADFIWAAIRDMVCCIRENYEYLCSVSNHTHEYIWGCGGGFQSAALTQLLADLIGKEIRIREGYQHASIIGGILVCNNSFGLTIDTYENKIKSFIPNLQRQTQFKLEEWKNYRTQVQKTFN